MIERESWGEEDEERRKESKVAVQIVVQRLPDHSHKHTNKRSLSSVLDLLHEKLSLGFLMIESNSLSFYGSSFMCFLNIFEGFKYCSLSKPKQHNMIIHQQQ